MGIGTTLNNRLRMKELRRLVSQNSSVEEIQAIGGEISENLEGHEKRLNTLVVEVKDILDQTSEGVANIQKVEPIVQSLKDSSETMNVKSLEETIEKLYNKQKQLSEIINRHEEIVSDQIEEIKSNIFVQSNNVVDLAHIQQ